MTLWQDLLLPPGYKTQMFNRGEHGLEAKFLLVGGGLIVKLVKSRWMNPEPLRRSGKLHVSMSTELRPPNEDEIKSGLALYPEVKSWHPAEASSDGNPYLLHFWEV